MAMTKRSKRLFGFGLALLLVLGAVAYYGLVLSDPPWFDPDAGGDTALADSGDAGGAIEATAEAGIADVAVTVRAEMPEGLDDGVPKRRFTGEGTLDLESSVAALDYGVKNIPNAAGYLGHVNGDLEVVYSGSGFVATFPQMAEVLEDSEWMFYDIEALSNPRAIQLGIGQLREIGLSDPRLGLALLNGAEGELTSGPVQIDLEAAEDETADPAVADMVRMLRERVGARTAEAEVTLDDDGRISSTTYSLTYPAVPKDVSVTIRIDLTGFDAAPIEVPEENNVTNYAEFLEI